MAAGFQNIHDKRSPKFTYWGKNITKNIIYFLPPYDQPQKTSYKTGYNIIGKKTLSKIFSSKKHATDFFHFLKK